MEVPGSKFKLVNSCILLPLICNLNRPTNKNIPLVQSVRKPGS